MLGLLAVAIAAGGGYLVYDKIQSQIDSNRTIAVPDVGQLTRNNAVIQIRDQGLRVRIVHLSSDTIPVGSVTGQNPGAGDRVAKDTTVTITVSTGKPKVQVPFLTGLPVAQAVSELDNRGLRADQHSVYSPNADAGTITAESPPGGTLVLKGSIVRINVSQGPRLLEVPNVVGQPYANARSALEGRGFTVAKSEVNASAPIDEVTGQDPAGGANSSPARR